MASNPLPKGENERLKLARAEVGGLLPLRVEIGVSIVDETTLQAAIDEFDRTEAIARTAHLAQTQKQAELDDLRHQNVVLAGAVKRYLTDEPGFGARANAQWQEVGFPHGTLFIDRQNIEFLVESMGIFLAAHPQFENAARGITGQECAAKAAAAQAARNDLGLEKAACSAAIRAKNAAFAALGKLMSALVGELKLRLAPDDARYYAFGLRRPSDIETPPAPRNLEVSGAGTGNIFAQWSKTPRAARYHVFLGLNGQNPTRVATIHECEWSGRELESGARAQIWVTAVNDSGESAASETREILVE